MTSASSAHSDAIALRATIRVVGLDDWSAVRHLHASAFERLTGPLLDADAAHALRARLAAPDYTETLQRLNLSAAWLDGLMVGTAGWLPGDDSGHSARITAVCVQPLFTRIGLGRRLVRDAEARARGAGFTTFTARATDTAVAFFRALGYEVTSQGSRARLGDPPIPVTFLRRSEGARAQAAASCPADDHAIGTAAEV